MTTARRSVRVFSLLCLAVLAAVLVSPGWVPHLQSLLDEHLSRPAEAAPAPSPAADRDLVVCFGYADLEYGITPLQPTQTGRVSEVLVRENDTVSAGAPLLQLDSQAARLRVREAEAGLAAAKAQLLKAEQGRKQHGTKIAQQEAAVEAARHRIASARHTLAAKRRKLELQAVGRSREDPVDAEDAAAAAERVRELQAEEDFELRKLADLQLVDPAVEVEHARAEVGQADAKLQQAQQTLEEHTLRAPQAGKVLRIFINPGELVGSTPKKMAVQFCPEGPRVIRSEVDQAFARRVQVGGPAVIEDDGTPGVRWTGRVSRMADWYTQRRMIADEQLQLKDVRSLECIVALDPGQAPLRIGQRVRVSIHRPQR